MDNWRLSSFPCKSSFLSAKGYWRYHGRHWLSKPTYRIEVFNSKGLFRLHRGRPKNQMNWWLNWAKEAKKRAKKDVKNQDPFLKLYDFALSGSLVDWLTGTRRHRRRYRCCSDCGSQLVLVVLSCSSGCSSHSGVYNAVNNSASNSNDLSGRTQAMRLRQLLRRHAHQGDEQRPPNLYSPYGELGWHSPETYWAAVKNEIDSNKT